MNIDDITKGLNNKLDKQIAGQGAGFLQSVKRIPSKIIDLDRILGGGVPLGRVVDIAGIQSSGKSSLAFTIAGEFQKKGKKVALIDAEYSYLGEHAEKLGVNTDDLIVVQPDCFEEGAEAIEYLARNGVSLIILDSLPALLPRAEGEAEHGKAPMAIQARLMSQMMRKTIAIFAKHECTLLVINQLRVNMMSMNPYDTTTSTGGHALRYYASIQLKVKKKQGLKSGANMVGHIVNIKVIKNKTANPYGECDLQYFLDTGFEKNGDLVQAMIDKGWIEQKGAWFTSTKKCPTEIGSDLKIQGKESVRQFLTETGEEKVVSLLFPDE